MIDDKLVDLSTYDMETWNPACFAANGVTRAIVGVYPGPTEAVKRVTSLRAAGITVIGVYGVPYWGDSPHYVTRDIEWAIAVARDQGIGTVWVDAEIDAWQIGVNVGRSYPGQRIEQLRASLQRVEAHGLRAGIYTAAWWWDTNTAYSKAFKDYPLWHAHYRQAPMPTPGFGGWTSAEIHQYTSTRELCGRGRDHNYLFTESGAEAQEEDMAAIEALEKRIAELERRTGGTGERARNADLLAYIDGVNVATLSMGEAVQQLAAATPVDTEVVAEALQKAVDELRAVPVPATGEPT